MRLYSSFNFYAFVYGVGLTAVSNLHDVAARIVGSSDIRENIKESKSFAKMNKGEECIKLEADISKTKKDTENVDIGVLGCGDALICLEDASSSTGARCVEFVESNQDNCASDSSPCGYFDGNLNGEYYPCCDGYYCDMGDGICVSNYKWFRLLVW